jgi:hypothetical protein
MDTAEPNRNPITKTIEVRMSNTPFREDAGHIGEDCGEDTTSADAEFTANSARAQAEFTGTSRCCIPIFRQKTADLLFRAVFRLVAGELLFRV